MNYIYVGKITNTHGIKGEVRILSDFEYIDNIMIPNFTLYIGDKKEKVEIVSHRIHKEYHMVFLKGYTDINQVLFMKGKSVYINRNDLKIDGYFNEDYIGLKAYSDRYLGEVSEVLRSNAHDILVIEKDKKRYMIPKIDVFIEKVDLKEHKIIIKEIKGLIDEN